MMHNRLDPADIDAGALEDLSKVLARPGCAALIDEKGHRVELPAPLFAHLARLVHLMAQRRAVILIPEDETFTTQAAADYLGVSRQHLVGLLESGAIPFHKVGTHHRVYFRDLMRYEEQRDAARKGALDRLMREVGEAGLYDGSHTGDSG